MKNALTFQIALGCFLLWLPSSWQLGALSLALHLNNRALGPIIYFMYVWVWFAPLVLILAGIFALRGQHWGVKISCVFDGLVALAAASALFPMFWELDQGPFVPIMVFFSAVILLVAAPMCYCLRKSLRASRYERDSPQ